MRLYTLDDRLSFEEPNDSLGAIGLGGRGLFWSESIDAVRCIKLWNEGASCGYALSEENEDCWLSGGLPPGDEDEEPPALCIGGRLRVPGGCGVGIFQPDVCLKTEAGRLSIYIVTKVACGVRSKL